MNLRIFSFLLLAGCMLHEHAASHSLQECVASSFNQALVASRNLDEQRLRTMQVDPSCIDASAQWQIAYLRGYINYRRAEALMANQLEGADDALVRAIHHLSDASEQNPDCAVCYALLSSAQGKRIALSPIRGIYLGGRVEENIETAIALDGDHPVVLMLRANRRLYTPERFGGDTERAYALFERALEAFENAETTPGWNVAEVHHHLAAGAEREGECELARRHLEAALEIDATFRAARIRLERLAVDQEKCRS